MWLGSIPSPRLMYLIKIHDGETERYYKNPYLGGMFYLTHKVEEAQTYPNKEAAEKDAAAVKEITKGRYHVYVDTETDGR